MFATESRPMRVFALASLALLALFGVAAAQTGDPAREAVILKIDGPVTPANAQYLAREIGRASDADKELIVIEIDTPGGLVDSMKTIIKAMLASETPVATYVSPQGARSASAVCARPSRGSRSTSWRSSSCVSPTRASRG